MTWDKIRDRALTALAAAVAAFLATLLGQPSADQIAKKTATQLTAHYASLPAAK